MIELKFTYEVINHRLVQGFVEFSSVMPIPMSHRKGNTTDICNLQSKIVYSRT